MPQKTSKHHYENNPFFIASSGITALFNLAKGVGIMLIVFSVVALFGNAVTPDNSSTTTASSSNPDFGNIFQGWGATEWIFALFAVGIIGLAFVMINALFSGVNSYTSARLSQGEEVALREAFRESFDKLWSFIWLQIIIFVKLFLWTLLFIVPGIIMAVRYSLASVAFFDDTKNLRGNAAIQESLRLTKDAWITTYAATALFNVLTLGAISAVVGTGANAILYRQLQEAGDKKPAAHWLSWLTLVLPFALLGLLFGAFIVVAIIVGLLGHGTA